MILSVNAWFAFMAHCFKQGSTLILLAIILFFLGSCSPVSKGKLNKTFNALEQTFSDHTGFMLYDPVKKKELYARRASQYYIPASNTKIFTLYTALTLLGDSIPGLQYIEKGDSLIFRGTADPSFLYKEITQSGKVYDFLNTQTRSLFLVADNFYTTPLGRGWAWDDLQSYYSAERSAFPVYGNLFVAEHADNILRITPSSLSYQVSIEDSTETTQFNRALDSNKITYNPGKKSNGKKQWTIPVKTSPELTAELLSDTLKKKVTVLKTPPSFAFAKTLFSVPADSVYTVMMQESDNFIAEQLLLMCAGILSDSLKPEIAIRYMKENHLQALPDALVWVDGSGLSRFNLFTPRSLVKLWEKLYEQIPHDRLFSMVAVGGRYGTLKNYYKQEPPYIYGKTGTLTNNNSLSGFLITKKGRTLIFSFMSNNYPATAHAVRLEMEKILKTIYVHY